MSLSPRLSSDSQATAAAAAAAVASTTGLTPCDIATAAETSSVKSSFFLPAPALPMSASAAAQQPMTGAEFDPELELDPDMFVIKDLDSGKKYDLQQVSDAYIACTTCSLALLL